jgi:hypothetical protein
VTTANYGDAVKLDEGDRRACVVRFGTRENVIRDVGYWNAYHAWVREGGAAALYGFLLQRDLSGFEPHGRAPHTEWKDEVTDSTRGAMEHWVRELWEDPDAVLPPILMGAKVLTPEQLGAAYYPGDPGKNTPGLRNALGMRMKEMGFKRTEQVKIDGAPKRFWIVGDRDKLWSGEAIRAAYHKGKW